jgi:orotidine-5'-phosphate decarboxylase
MPFLVPGVGAQGGDVAALMAAGQGGMLIINSSRAIIYASEDDDFANAARQAARQTVADINLHRSL